MSLKGSRSRADTSSMYNMNSTQQQQSRMTPSQRKVVKHFIARYAAHEITWHMESNDVLVVEIDTGTKSRMFFGKRGGRILI